VSDLLASRLYGVDHIIAPMVETPYALTKFAEARDKTYGDDPDTRSSCSISRPRRRCGNLDAMLPIAKAKLDGIVFGRVDFTLSRGLPRNAINDRQITDAVLTGWPKPAPTHGLTLVVGGSVAVEAGPCAARDPPRPPRPVRDPQGDLRRRRGRHARLRGRRSPMQWRSSSPGWRTSAIIIARSPTRILSRIRMIQERRPPMRAIASPASLPDPMSLKKKSRR
jgi:hypothetical protein